MRRLTALLLMLSIAGASFAAVEARFFDGVSAGMSIVVGPWPSPTASPASGPDYSDFLVFGEYGVVLGNGSSALGLVGSRYNNDDNPNAAPPARYPGQHPSSLQLAGGSIIDDDARIGGNGHADNGVTITGALYHVGTFTHGSAFSGTTTQVSDPGLPDGSLASESDWPGGLGSSCPTGGANHTGLPNGFSLTLTPGSHGAIAGGGAGDLTFHGAGDYFVSSIVAGNGLEIHVPTPGVRLFVCEKIQLGSGADVLPTSLGPTDFTTEVAGIGVPAGTNAFTAAAGSDWIGDLLVPTRGVHYGGAASTWKGHIWADHVDIEGGVVVSRLGPAALSAPQPTASATLAPTSVPTPTATATAEPPTVTPVPEPTAAPATPTPDPTVGP